MTQPLHFALVGENMQSSQSPRIFEEIFKRTNQAGRFDLLSVNRDDLGAGVKRLVSEGAGGFSVTIPHKQAVIELLDEIDPVAKSLKAVNSVAIRDGRLFGYNTDCYGVTYALKRATVSLGDGSALIYGSGGAARAVVHALYHDFGMRQFPLCGRSNDRLDAFAMDMSKVMTSIEITTVGDHDPQNDMGNSVVIVINCTPLGGANHPEAAPFPSEQDWSGVKFYFDLNYNEGNRAISLMREQSIPVIDGSVMLVAQAIKSFELWTGGRVDFEPVYHEVFGGRK